MSLSKDWYKNHYQVSLAHSFSSFKLTLIFKNVTPIQMHKFQVSCQVTYARLGMKNTDSVEQNITRVN